MPEVSRPSLHHADWLMRCPACNVPWPCEPFVRARQVCDRNGERPIVIEVERVLTDRVAPG